ncbi:MAG: HEPN domain-containing protein [Bacteroidia bacterium]
MTPEDREYILKWYEKADHDIRNAKLVLSYEPLILDTACFHCQQCIEKYLKAYLYYKGEKIPKIHDLTKLRKSCAKYDAGFDLIDFKDLNAYAVEVRYPDNFLEPSADEVKEYIQIAEDIKELVLSKVELS